MELNQWSVDADNNNMPPPHGWPEGMNYSQVNDAARELMAVVKRWHDDLSGKLSAAGSANAYMVTLNAAYSQYFAGMKFRCKIPATNSGASTLNVNSIGTRQIVRGDGSAIGPGTLVSGRAYTFYYDGTNFKLDTSDISDAAIPVNIARRNEANTFEGPVTLKTGSVTAAFQVSAGGLAINAEEGIALNDVDVATYARTDGFNDFKGGRQHFYASGTGQTASRIIDLLQEGAPEGARRWTWRIDANGTLRLQPVGTGTDLGLNAIAATRTGINIDSVDITGDDITLNNVSYTDFARLSQLNTFSAASHTEKTNYEMTKWQRLDAPAGEQVWRWGILTDGSMELQTRDDNNTGGAGAIRIYRDGTTITDVKLSGQTATFDGNVAINGNITSSGNTTWTPGGTLILGGSANQTVSLRGGGAGAAVQINGGTNVVLIRAGGVGAANTVAEFGPTLITLARNVTLSGTLTVSGVVTGSSFSGSGASLTNLNASNFSSGTVPGARLGGNQTMAGNKTFSGSVSVSGTFTVSGTARKASAGGFLHNASSNNLSGRITLSSSEASTAAQVGSPGDMRFVYQ